LTFRHFTRAAATIALTAGISLPLSHAVAQTALDDVSDPTATNGFLGDFNPLDLISSYIPTSPDALDCPEGTYHLLFEGQPVVSDSNGTPVCVTEDANGNFGTSVPGEPGQAGGESNSQGEITYGDPGEVPA
jgi:hypothetical protein